MIHSLKGFITVFSLFFCLQASSQSVDFNDGTLPAAWAGQADRFSISATGELQLNAPAGTSDAYLSWPATTQGDCLWEWYVRYGFSASTTNYSCLYVLTQQENPLSSPVSYYLKVGGISGSGDKIELYYQDGTSKVKILESRAGVAGKANAALRIRLSRSATGEWALYSDSTGQHDFTQEATAVHASTALFQYSAIRCVFSSTRRDKIMFDDISVRQLFAVTGYHFPNEQTLSIHFTKPIDTTRSAHVSVSCPTLSAEITMQANEMLLHCLSDIQAGTYLLQLDHLYTSDGDSLLNPFLSIHKKATYVTGQIRITELMADPSPSFGLPETEYIELLNTADRSVLLSDLLLQDQTSSCRLPDTVLNAHAVLLLCPPGGCASFTTCFCLEVTDFPSLNNDADSITLLTNEHILLDVFDYSISRLPADYRSDGGYAIVRATLPAECSLSGALTFSSAEAGGTPGIIDVIPTDPRVIIQTNMVNDSVFTLSASMYGYLPVQALSLSRGLTATILSDTTGAQCAWTIALSEPLEKGYSIAGILHSLQSCTHTDNFPEQPFHLINPAPPGHGSLYLNEILYNPSTGGVDFIELYHPGETYIQLQGVQFYHTDKAGNTQHTSIQQHLILAPDSYLALCTDTLILFKQYPDARRSGCVQLRPFLSLPDEGGSLWITFHADTLDSILYGDDLQNPLNRNDEGISLEKIKEDEQMFYPSNWTSSATGATPGFINSQHLTVSSSGAPFHCEPCHLTRNTPGQRDFILFHLKTDQAGARGNIRLYSIAGEKVADLLIDQMMSPENEVRWDGQGNNHAPLPDGIYIAVAEWWMPNGDTFKSKIPVSTSQY